MRSFDKKVKQNKATVVTISLFRHLSITKVDTTVSVLNPGASTASTFGASRKLPYRTTLPLSNSLPLRHLADQADGSRSKLERSDSTNGATTVVENPMALSNSASSSKSVEKGNNVSPPTGTLSMIKQNRPSSFFQLPHSATFGGRESKGGVGESTSTSTAFPSSTYSSYLKKSSSAINSSSSATSAKVSDIKEAAAVADIKASPSPKSDDSSPRKASSSCDELSGGKPDGVSGTVTMPNLKTSTLPSSARGEGSGGDRGEGLTKSSTLPNVKPLKPLSISRPILQV